MNRRYDIVIVGGGITGLLAAVLLARGRAGEALDITIVDSAPRPHWTAHDDVGMRVSAIASGSAAILAGVGAWDFVAAQRACAYERMRVWDEHDTPGCGATLRFDAQEFGVPQLGFIAENALLQAALLRRLDDTGVQLLFASPLRALRRGVRAYEIELDTGDRLNADLLIGADGARSFVRSAVGIEAREWPYAQTAFVTHLESERPHRATAWQRFLRAGPLGLLPLADGRISAVWSTTAAEAQAALAADDATTGRMLSDASDYVLGALEVAGPKGAFPLCARHASQYVLPNVALIGDAAHAIHPLAGQGANLGLRDAAELASQVERALAEGMHPGDRPALRRYERARRGANATMMHLMTGLNSLFGTDSVTIGGIRRAGMRAFNRSGPIRERAVRVALGVD